MPFFETEECGREIDMVSPDFPTVVCYISNSRLWRS